MIFVAVFVLLFFLSSGIYFFQERLIFFPEQLAMDYQFNFGLDFEEINYDVDENIKINALHFKTDSPKGIIFYSHGNAGSLSRWGSVADVFLQHNYDVLIYDYRGYGKSNGSISEANFYHDASYIYKQLANEYGEDYIIVYGRSIGTGIASKVASEFSPKHLVLESPYYNLPDLVHNIFPIVPSFLLKYKFRTDQMIQKVKCPITIFHGTIDEVIYFNSTVKLEKLLKKEDTVVPIIGGHHNDLEDFETYHQELAKVLF